MTDERCDTCAGYRALIDALAGNDVLFEPHVIVVDDPLTTVTRVYGPYADGPAAVLAASKIEADIERTTNVAVQATVKPLHRPSPSQ